MNGQLELLVTIERQHELLRQAARTCCTRLYPSKHRGARPHWRRAVPPTTPQACCA